MPAPTKPYYHSKTYLKQAAVVYPYSIQMQLSGGFCGYHLTKH